MTRAGRAGPVCGLFAGIGGLELGFTRAGYGTSLLCEINVAARSVLRARFPESSLEADILELDSLPVSDVVAAGFPCQDLSMAGAKEGISGEQSSLIGQLFSLLRDAAEKDRIPRWLIIENVPYMLHLQRGQAMAKIVSELEGLGFRWAYRVVDARAFGIPQRRLRVLLVASSTEDPRPVLFADDAEPAVDDSTTITDDELAYGFYWTEGKRGLGWTVDGVPTIKGGSTIGIPSPPAIWIRSTGEVGTPDIRDLERLQGFPEDWTAAAAESGDRRSRGSRFSLVGNAVCVPVSEWLARNLERRMSASFPTGVPLKTGAKWPTAAWGGLDTEVHGVNVSTWPASRPRQSLRDFLRHPLKPLSARATAGYLKRAGEATTLRFPEGFLAAMQAHLDRMLRSERSPGAAFSRSAPASIEQASQA